MSIIRIVWETARDIALMPFLLLAGIIGWVASYL